MQLLTCLYIPVRNQCWIVSRGPWPTTVFCLWQQFFSYSAMSLPFSAS